MPSALEVHKRVDVALAAFVQHELLLIAAGPSERALTHKLAAYVQSAFPEWDVDCEYNRDGAQPKRISPGAAASRDKRGKRPVLVLPDIIVHRRGKAGPNLLVIEAKKATSRSVHTFDRLKLAASKTELAYEFAAFILLPAGEGALPWVEWI